MISLPPRQIDTDIIYQTLKEVLMNIAFVYSEDVISIMELMRELEDNQRAISILDTLSENAKIASANSIPLCQDTGMAVIDISIGQQVIIEGDSLEYTVQNAVRDAYQEAYLRNSIVSDPLFARSNTGDNTPAVIYYHLVTGNQLTIEVAAKGFGSENMSRIKMCKPAEGVQGVKDFVLETVKLAGPNACPPLVVGVGIGGTFDYAAFLAKKALFRPLDFYNEDENYALLEKELLEEINQLHIGPMGLGGKTTALKVNIEWYPTHIAALPVAVNINCHVNRHQKVII